MKRVHKQILGFLGLGAVVATTVFAAGLPGPGAVATDSVTDTIKVTVVGSSPDVSITGVPSGEVTVTPEQSFTVNYNDIETVTVSLKYTNMNGDEVSTVIESIDTGYAAGSKDFALSLDDLGYGYGKYLITVSGMGIDDGDEDSVVFYYYPVSVDEVNNNEDGTMDIGVNYDPANVGSQAGENGIDHVNINLYDADGNPVTGFDTQTVHPDPNTGSVTVNINFAHLHVPYGEYIVGFTAYNENGQKVYNTVYFSVTYKESGSVTPIPVPDTGQFTEGLNISKTDYLITGIIIFTVVGTGGAIFIMRRDRKTIGKGQRR